MNFFDRLKSGDFMLAMRAALTRSDDDAERLAAMRLAIYQLYFAHKAIIAKATADDILKQHRSMDVNQRNEIFRSEYEWKEAWPFFMRNHNRLVDSIVAVARSGRDCVRIDDTMVHLYLQTKTAAKTMEIWREKTQIYIKRVEDLVNKTSPIPEQKHDAIQLDSRPKLSNEDPTMRRDQDLFCLQIVLRPIRDYPDHIHKQVAQATYLPR